MLEEVTPVLLTFNEAANIGRTLSGLTWAKDIVVVDSGSTDDTIAILAKFAQVRVFHRAFDTHGNQWRYAIQQTGIGTSWILRLDADYQVTTELKAELSGLDPNVDVDAYTIPFDYAIFDQKLISSLYPPNTILVRKDRVSILDKGHTEAWVVKGPVKRVKARIVHDDRKPTERWMSSQGQYMRRELAQLRKASSGLRAWLRLTPPLMPLLIFFYCLFVKGLILNGRAGIFYALQRLIAEAALSLMVIEEKLGKKDKQRSERDLERPEVHAEIGRM
jgi:glycosyltransferase involved in cell wall biosynthesis